MIGPDRITFTTTGTDVHDLAQKMGAAFASLGVDIDNYFIETTASPLRRDGSNAILAWELEVHAVRLIE